MNEVRCEMGEGCELSNTVRSEGSLVQAVMGSGVLYSATPR